MDAAAPVRCSREGHAGWSGLTSEVRAEGTPTVEVSRTRVRQSAYLVVQPIEVPSVGRHLEGQSRRALLCYCVHRFRKGGGGVGGSGGEEKKGSDEKGKGSGPASASGRAVGER